jgi:hypothetical protein
MKRSATETEARVPVQSGPMYAEHGAGSAPDLRHPARRPIETILVPLSKAIRPVVVEIRDRWSIGLVDGASRLRPSLPIVP